MERREDVSGQEGCRVESLEKSTAGTEERGWTGETGNGEEARGGKEEGQERSSATLFVESGWTGLLVNYEMKDHCRCCWVDQGRETLNKD